MIICGLDPDSMKHGVAVYVDGKLQQLLNVDLPALRAWIDSQSEPLHFCIEDVMSQSFVYMRNTKASKAAQSKVGVSIGRCQQAQVEVQRELDARQISYELRKPMQGNWAENKVQFEKFTGWTGKSNPETRSAAFFGFLAVRSSNRNRNRQGSWDGEA